MIRFSNEKMYEIVSFIQKELDNKNIVEFEVLNPDIKDSLYAGESVIVDETKYVYRGYKVWTDLAQKLFCKMLTPKEVSKDIVKICFKKLNEEDSFHKLKIEETEKYGENSSFFRINKNEQPEILLSYLEALKNVKIENRKRVLNLGINNGHEFSIIKEYFSCFSDLEFVGIDFCQSAIEKTQEVFKEDKNVKLYTHDIKKLDELDLGQFDLIISVGTFQSSNLNLNETFMSIVQKYLKKDGSMILGFPNCRWYDGEVIYGAKVPNYNFSEMSLLFKDAFFCKKYLQQKKFRVTLTGQYYIFLTATSIRK